MERPVLNLCSGFPGFVRLLLPLAVVLSGCVVAPPGQDAASDSSEPPPLTGTAPPGGEGSVFTPRGEGREDSLAGLRRQRVTAPEPTSRYENLWGRIYLGLRLQQHYERPEVREQMRLFERRPDYFEQVGERARPFLHNIVEQIEQRGMPMEIALMPFVESSFNPYARSPRAAAGPWQFMAKTGRSLGLRVDEWFDGRRDPIQATTAALDYLEIQQQRFEGNWLLAFAAFNSGPATVSRAVRMNPADPASIEFWDLPLPDETQVHVPRILALAALLSGRGETELPVPDIADEQALERVKVGSGANLALAAELAGLEPQLLRDLNPGFRHWWTPPDGDPDFVNLPSGNAGALRLALQQNPASVEADLIRYLVQPGDSMWAIARRYGVRLEDLLRWNSLEADQLIFPGQMLNVAPPSYQPSYPLN
ncbi:MAG: transglycosylase SLT domain-containing protein [Gammaproteobacteria bacterium]|nr:transglycosylase SLT domain-containing protein [Gammaproteobacteria bacterium]